MHQGSLLKLCALYVEIKLENYVCSCSCAICKFDEVCLHLYTIHACDKFLAHFYIKKKISFLYYLACCLHCKLRVCGESLDGRLANLFPV